MLLVACRWNRHWHAHAALFNAVSWQPTVGGPLESGRMLSLFFLAPLDVFAGSERAHETAEPAMWKITWKTTQNKFSLLLINFLNPSLVHHGRVEQNKSSRFTKTQDKSSLVQGTFTFGTAGAKQHRNRRNQTRELTLTVQTRKLMLTALPHNTQNTRGNRKTLVRQQGKPLRP